MAKQVNLLQGGIVSPLTRLALPIMGTQLMQMAYNLIDMLWIGKIGVGAMAAVGAVGLYMWLSAGLVILARMGGQVTVAQSIGAGDMEKAGRFAAASLQLGAALALGYTVLMIAGAGPLIGFFNLNSAEVIRDAHIYMILVALGMPFSFLNQVLVAVITATGNSHTPFVAMAVGLGANIVLDPLLIFGWGFIPQWGVAGAAVATSAAQGFVFLILVLYAVKDQYLFPHVHLFKPASGSDLAKILKISGPATAMNVLFPMISMVIARFVASWGDGAVAVQKVGSQVESISWMTADGFAAATNSFVGQNYGAKNLKRAKKGFHAAFGMMTIWGACCSLLLIFGAEPIFRIFITDPEVVPIGVDYLRILGVSELFVCWEILVSGAYAGFGRTLGASVVSSLFTALRIPFAVLLSATALGLSGIWWTISISSICKGLILVIMFSFFLAKLTRNEQTAAN